MEHPRSPRRELVDRLWDVAGQVEEFEDLVAAWDAYEATHHARGTLDTIGADPQLMQEFARAAMVVDEGEAQDTQAALDRFLAALIDPGLIMDEDGSVLSVDPRLIEGLADDEAAAAVDALAAGFAASLRDAPDGQGRSRLVRLPFRPGSSKVLFLAEQVELGASPRWVLRRATIPWTASRGRVLVGSFALTETELEIVEHLYSGLDATGVAAARDRSVHTTRTQIKTILSKVGASDQRELFRIVSATMRTGDDTFRGAGGLSRRSTRAGYSTHVLDVGQGRKVELCRYGAEGGVPVFFIQPTTLPTPEPELARLAERAGLDIVSPWRPGSGRSTDRAAADGPHELSEDYLACIDQLGLDGIVVAGHCSGGLYAVALAARLGRRARGLLTVDTGAPLLGLDDIRRMQATPRRTFLGMRYAPGVMLAPHKMVARRFFSGPEGEARVIDYFYDSCPQESARVASDPRYRALTRDNIAYSLENPERLVADVQRWAEDWTPLAERLPPDLPKRALLGALNGLFRVPALERWAQLHGWTTDIVEDEGQLLIYGRPARLIDALVAVAGG
ncbi:alpha/beta hydrolase [Roseobacter sp. HKCCA0434]|uniref:alpha/beta hydrolase n=1 Tax=Roseobacter sp. HKCCA0434 TaxID=3079297 RepID=UPI00290587BB|nr:alpha/beta hydrolase [Roseobacter sp. HKCCA0434]